MEFDGKEFGKSEILTSEGTENIFFKVSQQTDAILKSLKMLAGKDYLFYWVDAVFVKSERAKNDIETYLKRIKFEFKTVKIDKVVKEQGQIIVYDSGRKKPRPFIFESTKAKDLTKIIP